MANAAWALQKAMLTALTGNAALVALLGGARIYDDVPDRSAFPFVAFSAVTARDFSTGTELALEHIATMNVWSRAKGKREAAEIADAVCAVLDRAALSLDGHRLVNLQHETTDIRRDGDGDTVQASLRFRAVTEAL